MEQSDTPVADSSTTETPQTLDQVYKEFNIEEQAQEFRQAPAREAPKAETIPDPILDTEGFRSYQQRQAEGNTALQQSLQQITGEFTALKQAANRQALEADIKKAVTTINEKLKLDPDLIEASLEMKARKDPKFKTIWNNREKNPRALDAALKAVSHELGEKYTVRQDAQLIENQRAAKISQQTMATTKANSPDDKWDNMSPRERAQERERIKNSQY